ncbi:MAG: hypothetical protein HY814_07295 [Candidatus Riflebacteria bacterium]|nr:hypothetical protein [Candidatus Riflebacteria bacterium]
MTLQPLPIDAHVPRIVRTLREGRHAVIVAPPGSGKTTRLPPALLAFGRVILLQPRRIAARSLARRIAGEQGWTVGEEIGWQVRFERRFGPSTCLLVATEGILTARLQTDPLLSVFAVAVIDEFHERTLHADLALALAREAAAARDDLRLIVMSATLDAAPVAEFLGGCPVVELPGRPHPIELRHAPELTPVASVRELLEPVRTRQPAGRPGGGHMLVFLPGAPEIRRAAEELAALQTKTGRDPEDAWLATACAGRTSLSAVDFLGAVPRDVMRQLDRLAPETIPIPSGRQARLEYREDGTVTAAVKLQEMFGLAETPRVGPRREPVTLSLLAPSGRPVQTTRDLRSFWDRGYPEVRKELRGRYPRHPWPEDPWTAPATHKTKARRR